MRNSSIHAGVLYPLERSFLYTFKPELIPYDQIESIEFERQQSGMHASSLRTFDLSVVIKADAAMRTKHFQFRCDVGLRHACATPACCAAVRSPLHDARQARPPPVRRGNVCDGARGH